MGERISILSDLAFFLSTPRPCGYLPGRESNTLFADPDAEMTPQRFSLLAEYGFRRSGPYVYRPHCAGCSACVPVRVPVARFKPARGQRRTWKMNADLACSIHDPTDAAVETTLYRRYLGARHAGGPMDAAVGGNPLDFLASPWSETFLCVFELAGKPVAIAVTDVLARGLSAVYTYFDPGLPRRSLGTYAVLWQIEEARRRGLEHLYLGYWIADCRKMNYKTRFRPLEGFIGGEWRPLAP